MTRGDGRRARAGRPRSRGLRVGVASRAVGRHGGLALSVAERAACVRQPPLELAHLVGGPLGLCRTLLGLLSAARALGLFAGARPLIRRALALDSAGLPLRALPAAQELELSAGL